MTPAGRVISAVFVAALVAGCCCPKKCGRKADGPGSGMVRAPDRPGLYLFDGENLTSWTAVRFSLTGSGLEDMEIPSFKSRELLKGQHPLYIIPETDPDRAFYFDGEMMLLLRNYRVETAPDGSLRLVPEPPVDPNAKPDIVPLKK